MGVEDGDIFAKIHDTFIQKGVTIAVDIKILQYGRQQVIKRVRIFLVEEFFS
jgi:hypothetical protein